MEILIFGAGQRGKRYLHLLQDLQIAVDYFCDNDEKIQGSSVEGIEVFSPQTLKCYHQGANVLLANRFHTEEIGRQLDAMGICYSEEIEEIIFHATRLT